MKALADMEEKIQTLESFKAALQRLVTACRGRGPTSECPILEAMNSQEKHQGIKICQPLN